MAGIQMKFDVAAAKFYFIFVVLNVGLGPRSPLIITSLAYKLPPKHPPKVPPFRLSPKPKPPSLPISMSNYPPPSIIESPPLTSPPIVMPNPLPPPIVQQPPLSRPVVRSKPTIRKPPVQPSRPVVLPIEPPVPNQPSPPTVVPVPSIVTPSPPPAIIVPTAPPVDMSSPPSFPITVPTPSPAQMMCPIDILTLGGCVDLLGEIEGIIIGIGLGTGGNNAKETCCPILEGLIDFDAALCLCIAIKAKLLILNIILPIALQVLSECGKNLPPGFSFTCPAS